MTTSLPTGLTLGPLLNALVGGIQAWVLRILLYLLVVLLSLRKLQHRADALIWAAVGLAAFLMFNVPAEAYLYVSVFILLVFAAIAKERERNEDVRSCAGDYP